MTFAEYLISKKIDSKAFLKKEKDLWYAWKFEFEQMHPKSFTAQKLYLVNPIRKKYPLQEEPKVHEHTNKEETDEVEKTKPVVKSTRPVFKQKPKF